MGLSPAAQAAIEAANKKIVDRDRNPLLVDLPPWVTGFRPHQVGAIRSVVSALERVPVVVMEAPTGAGKTLIGETVRRLLQTDAVYMCSTKSLQDQFLRDYPYAKVLKGRGNYPTELYPERFDAPRWTDQLSAEDCTWNGSRCDWCKGKASCPYERAKTEAIASDLCVVNTSYFLAETSMGDRSKLANWGLVIADEADTLESELMGFVSVDISESRMERWNWQPPAKVTVKDSWVEWIDEKLPLLKQMLGRLPTNTTDLRLARERKYVENLLGKLRVIRAGMDSDDSPWVYTGKGAEGSGRIKERNQGRAVSFKPARVDGLGGEVLWSKAPRWLLMSATVISAQEMLESLGYEGEWEFVPVPSTFPVKNRRVVVKNVADMAQKYRETSWPKMGDGVVELVNSHPNERVLIHAVSYDLARYLHSRLGNLYDLRGMVRAAITYGNAAGREAALREYLDRDASILVAPSMDRGIDLPGDACRVQIIAKVPFPYLGDRQIAARMHSKGGQTWYTVSTIRTIVQMCGRAVRSADDWAVTYVLDTQFSTGVFNRGRNLIPGWFKDAVVWDRD